MGLLNQCMLLCATCDLLPSMESPGHHRGLLPSQCCFLGEWSAKSPTYMGLWSDRQRKIELVTTICFIAGILKVFVLL